jgi:hypothetical protein
VVSEPIEVAVSGRRTTLPSAVEGEAAFEKMRHNVTFG